MHPDEAVELALQDLRSHSTEQQRYEGVGYVGTGIEPHGTGAPNAHPSRALELLRAYFSPLRWYVTDGRSPAGDVTETGHLPRPRFHAEPAESATDAALLPLALGADR